MMNQLNILQSNVTNAVSAFGGFIFVRGVIRNYVNYVTLVGKPLYAANILQMVWDLQKRIQIHIQPLR